MTITRRTFTGLAAGTLAAAALGPRAALAAPKVKAGFIYVGPIGDHGWSYQHNAGRLGLMEALGGDVATSFVESVSEGADAERVIRQLATTGHDIIFTTSFGYMNPTLKVARQFPKVKFEHCTGFNRAGNVSTYSGRFYEGRHVVGLMAAKMTKTKTLGYVASFPIPEVVRGINAITLAARSIDPEITTKVVWVNSWYDPGKEADAAKALIDQGVDVLFQHTDSPAPVQVAQERGIKTVGQASDMARFGPDAHMTAIVDYWDAYYIERVKAVMDGTWESKDTWGGFAADMVHMAPFNPNLPADVVSMAEAAVEGIASGKVHPFAGPVVKQGGEVVAKADEIISDEALLSMNYYVEGVQGDLPS